MLAFHVRDRNGELSDQRRSDVPKYSGEPVETAEFIKTSLFSSLLEQLSSASASFSFKLSPTSSRLDSASSSLDFIEQQLLPSSSDSSPSQSLIVFAG